MFQSFLLTLSLPLDDPMACGRSRSPPASRCPAHCGSPRSDLTVDEKAKVMLCKGSNRTLSEMQFVFMLTIKYRLEMLNAKIEVLQGGCFQ